jgi:hypothetical protein
VWSLLYLIADENLDIQDSNVRKCPKFPGVVIVVIVLWLELQLPMQSVPITTNVVSLNPAHGEVYSIQHYVIKFVSDLRQDCGMTGLWWPFKFSCSRSYLCVNLCDHPVLHFYHFECCSTRLPSSNKRCILDTTLCYKVCQWLVTGQWFSPVSSTNKTDCHDITEILLQVG